jgi:hypothetical protein
MRTKIYVLCESDGEIRYIGKTKVSLEKRLVGHLGESRRGSSRHRCNWIRSVLSNGYLPVIQLIGEVEGDGCKEEKEWIVYGKSEGWRLTNATDGGDGSRGYRWTEAQKARARVSHTGLVHTELTRLKIGQSLMGHKVSSKNMKALIASHKGKAAWNRGKHLLPETIEKMRNTKRRNRMFLGANVSPAPGGQQ